MGRYVLGLHEIERADVAVAGGKGANLGALARIDGVRVPPGFCVTTRAYLRAAADPPMPDDVAGAITEALAREIGDDVPCAVRSSATAEDLPGASFAGQHDSHLGVVGPDAVLEHVRRCWDSLFTERAVAYRRRNGIDDGDVQMAVVVQRLVPARAAGVLFTADPITSDRTVASVEAVAGLGEALVAGTVNPDVYTVRRGAVVEGSGQGVLTDDEVLALVDLGRRIEAELGGPQDIEWCLDGDGFHVVQSRPITTLFPVPQRNGGGNHVYVSVGHQQMMTDPFKPLGLSIWKLLALRPMYDAGGRFFVDVTAELSSPAGRAALFGGLGRSDPLIRDALESLLDRGDFLTTIDDDAGGVPAGPPPGAAAPPPLETDPAIVTELVERSQDVVDALRRDVEGRTGPELFEFVRAHIEETKPVLADRRSFQVLMAAFEAAWWLNDHVAEWLGEENVADTLSQSVPHNVTSEMGLALLDVADAIRPHPEVVAFLEGVTDDGFLDELPSVPGGREARDAIVAYLDRYGMRCVGEIDITRPRWRERPSALVPMLLADVRNFGPGEGRRRFEQGRQEALAKERELLARLRELPDGEAKAAETKRMIDRVRTFAGYREYPKYAMVSRLFVYKQALVAEAERLVAAGVLDDVEDAFFLTFDELEEVARRGVVDRELLRRRRAEHRAFEALTPPRVLTSDGEVLAGSYRRDDVPDGALAGLAVSAGTVEGRARVILDLADADVEPGDILVTAYTDPSWSPLFVAVSGLVTEVGGLMTHGAVVAREYGLPAVVGVEHATRRIRDGQRIRVHGTAGYVEVLDAA